MRILILGSSGLLGRALVDELRGKEVFPSTSNDSDIRDLAQVRELVTRTHPEWIIHAAAFTNVDDCESDPERAYAINRDGTRNVSVAAREAGAKLVYLSTNYVFDGLSTQPYEPNDPVHPLSAYGASKAAGEEAVQENHGQWIIARTSWVFGSAHPCFPEKIIAAASSQPELKVVNDQIGSPTYTKDLAGAIRRLIHMDARGILNITNSGSCTWFEYAKEILRAAGIRTSISAITSAESHRPARRPAYSVLSPIALNKRGITLRNWQAALDDYIEELRRTGKLR